ncbi:hypothetical protein BDF22DRAFT_219929 [Syncephalis plumigaleata]|nr:hypothetical protein BDF22DRAFT_219929 [Syncephalis plumigaleata]
MIRASMSSMNWKTVYHQPNYPGLEPYTHSSTIPLLTSINTTMKLSTFKIAAFVAATTICISNAVEALSAQKQHCLINEIRAKEGKQPFIHDASLAKVAEERALAMAEERWVPPQPIPGPSFEELLQEIDPDSKLKSLRGSAGIGPTDEEIVSNLNGSPANYAMIRGSSTHLGIGFAKIQNTYYWVHVLGTDTKASKKVETCPEF